MARMLEGTDIRLSQYHADSLRWGYKTGYHQHINNISPQTTGSTHPVASCTVDVHWEICSFRLAKLMPVRPSKPDKKHD